MSAAEDRGRLLAVARGDAEPDVVVEGGRVLSVFTREWLDGDVAIADGRIAGVGRYEGGERLDARGRFVVPGLIDAHVHIESSKLLPAEFARVVVARGTTTVVCDPHELANVLGADGAHWLLDASSALPLRVYVMAPSCVPASALESPRGPLGTEDMAGILRRRRAIGVAEVMDFPSVVAGDPGVLAKVALHPHVDGHAPGVTGPALDAYAAAGIRSDHEATTWEEALEKRRRGMWVLLREASNARNLVALLELVRRHGPEQCALCTDDREPDMLVREGHIDAMCRQAVAEGIAPEDVLVMATLHAALCHGLADLGAIAPGYRADLAVLDDLASFRASLVLAGGRVAARDGVALPFAAPPVPGWLRDTVHAAPLAPDALDLGPPAERVRVIDIVAGQLLTGAAEEPPAVRDGRDRRRSRRAISRSSPSSSDTTRRAASASGSSAASACARARSPRPSPTTRTTSSWWASTTRAWPRAWSGSPRWAAGSRSPTRARCGASWRCRSRACCPRSRPRSWWSGSTSSSRCCASRVSTARRRS